MIYGSIIVLVVMSFCLLLYKNESNGSLRVKVGNNELELQIDGDSRAVSIRRVLNQLFQDEEASRESKALLKEFGNFYLPTDPELIGEIEKQPLQSEVSERLRELLYGLKGPFNRQAHNYYDIENVQIVDALSGLEFNHPVSKGLRELLIYRRGPFEERSKEVLLSVPAGNNIPAGRAASCRGNDFFRREIRIFNAQRTHSISVFVSGSFPCNTDTANDIHRLIQLSYADMKNLLGDSPMGAKEPALAEIMINID
ncbi:hypothetical protein ACJJIF_14095 [Microbulbifer sp. SSSA002]|uniref:hypothetical protein n=1 Tax=Microbulbifer sp. SSSA002 TaxID=3243376 RepID=UPI00403A2A76